MLNILFLIDFVSSLLNILTLCYWEPVTKLSVHSVWMWATFRHCVCPVSTWHWMMKHTNTVCNLN